MECRGCGNTHAWAVKTSYGDGYVEESCNGCGFNGGSGVGDVYFKKPYFDRNLSTQEEPKGQFVTSRNHKAALLKKFGLREAGDRVHGSNGFDSIAHRHSQESLRRSHNGS